MFPRVSPDMIP